MTLDNILWMPGSMWAVSLPSPKQWCPGRECHRHGQRQNLSTVVELFPTIFITHRENGQARPNLLNLRRNILRGFNMFHEAVQPSSGHSVLPSALILSPGHVGVSPPAACFPRKRCSGGRGCRKIWVTVTVNCRPEDFFVLSESWATLSPVPKLPAGRGSQISETLTRVSFTVFPEPPVA